MIKVNELTANILKRDKNKIALNSAKTVDKITGNVLRFDYDIFTCDKVTELTAITNILTYADSRKEEEETNYFIRVNGILKLVSEQAFKLIKNTVSAGTTIIKGEEIPENTKVSKEYLNCFYQ